MKEFRELVPDLPQLRSNVSEAIGLLIKEDRIDAFQSQNLHHLCDFISDVNRLRGINEPIIAEEYEIDESCR